MTHRWFQLHLSTAVVMMLAAAIALQILVPVMIDLDRDNVRGHAYLDQTPIYLIRISIAVAFPIYCGVLFEWLIHRRRFRLNYINAAPLIFVMIVFTWTNRPTERKDEAFIAELKAFEVAERERPLTKEELNVLERTQGFEQGWPLRFYFNRRFDSLNFVLDLSISILILCMTAFLFSGNPNRHSPLPSEESS